MKSYAADESWVNWDRTFLNLGGRAFVGDGCICLDVKYLQLDKRRITDQSSNDVEHIFSLIPYYRFGLQEIRLANPGGRYVGGPDRVVLEREYVKLLRRLSFKNELQFGFCGEGRPVLLYDGDTIIGAIMPVQSIPIELVGKLCKDRFDPDPDKIEAEIAKGEGDLPEWAEKGCILARTILCEYYHRPNVKRWRALKAFEWYRDSAGKGLPNAQYMMGLYYCPDGIKGIVEPDEQKMLEWFLRAAKSGEPAAVSALAFAYERGEGCAIDLVKACALFDLMFARGNRFAPECRLRCMRQMTGDEVQEAYALSQMYLEQFPVKPIALECDLCGCPTEVCPPGIKKQTVSR
jgi:hypothetical protein